MNLGGLLSGMGGFLSGGIGGTAGGIGSLLGGGGGLSNARSMMASNPSYMIHLVNDKIAQVEAALKAPGSDAVRKQLSAQLTQLTNTLHGMMGGPQPIDYQLLDSLYQADQAAHSPAPSQQQMLQDMQQQNMQNLMFQQQMNQQAQQFTTLSNAQKAMHDSIMSMLNNAK